MRSFGILYKLPIFFLLIKFSSEAKCNESETHKKFCEDFNEYGQCKYQEASITLVECQDITDISKFKDVNDYTYLSLYNSEISTLSGCDFQGLPHLIYLNVSWNNVRNLAEGVFDNLPHLKILDLSHNNVRFVEDNSLAKVDSLEELHLNHNNISELPEFLGDCERLKMLDFSHNKIVNLSFLESCNNLVYLQVSNNNIYNVDSLTHLSKLMFLDISNNRLVYINTQIGLPNLRFLNLSQNMLFSIKREYDVYDITTTDSPVYYFRQTYTTPIPSIVIKVEGLPVRLFRDMSLLNTLILSNTGIINLELGTFTDFSNLAILDLSKNGLTKLPNGIFYELRHLNKLYLNNNQLQTFTYDNNLSLEEIDLNGNPWICGDLLELLRSLGNVNIVRRLSLEDRFETNIYGITCNGSSLNKLDRFLETIQKDIKYLRDKMERRHR